MERKRGIKIKIIEIWIVRKIAINDYKQTGRILK